MLDIQYPLKPKSVKLSEPLDQEKIEKICQLQGVQLRKDGTLPFGQLHSGHQFLMEYSPEKSWHSPRIVPYSPIGDHIRIMPCSNEYAQQVFEGAKAFKHPDGELYVFRFDQNAARLNNSARIVGEMPAIPVEDQIQAVHALLDVDRLWYPEQAGASMYIRPKIVALDDSRKVDSSTKYWFSITLSPSGAYFEGGFNKLTKFVITEKIKRVGIGGIGKAKFVGNYGASLVTKPLVRKFGAQQVLYLDPTHELIEEAGSNNHWQLSEGGVVIPSFTDNILESITSLSFIELSATGRLDISVTQRDIPVEEFIDGILSGEIREAGGFGTAASVSPGQYVHERDGKPLVPKDGVGRICRLLYETLTGIQSGLIEAPEGWLQRVERMQ